MPGRWASRPALSALGSGPWVLATLGSWLSGWEIGVWMMKRGEAKIVAARLRRVLGKDRITT